MHRLAGPLSHADAQTTMPELRDAAIAADIEEVLANHLVLRGLALELAVRGGVAHVRGQVATCAERALARRTIARVRGVNAVWDLLCTPGEQAPQVLDLGCGSRKQVDRAVGVDCHRLPAVDVQARIERGLPFPDASVDHVYAVHFLEHVDDLLAVMNEIHRVLKPDGVLHVMVPSARHVNALADPTHRRLFHRQTFKFFCRPYPGLRRFRPLGIAETDADLFADLQPLAPGTADAGPQDLARFFD